MYETTIGRYRGCINDEYAKIMLYIRYPEKMIVENNMMTVDWLVGIHSPSNGRIQIGCILPIAVADVTVDYV